MLFISAMDRLSLHIKRVVVEGELRALFLGRNIRISHSFFVDDVLIMGMITKINWLELYHIFYKFRNATGIFMNHQKYIILYGKSNMEDIKCIQRLFGVDADSLVGV